MAISRSCDCDEKSLENVTKLLTELRLLRPSEEASADNYVVLSPERALHNLLRDADRSLQSTVARLQWLQEAMQLVSTKFKPAHNWSFHDGFGKLALSEANMTVEDALETAHTEVLLSYSERELIGNLACLRQLSNRDVHVQVLYQSANGLGSVEARTCLRELANLGAKMRIIPNLPWHLAAIDRETVLLRSTTGPISDRSKHEILAVRVPEMIDHIVALYSHWWDVSLDLPVPLLNTAGGDMDAVHRAEQRLLLGMLSSGMTDEAIARKLGLSERTVRRRVAEITATLESSSRFQTGVNAVRAGWL